jgi:hypothetical protein
VNEEGRRAGCWGLGARRWVLGAAAFTCYVLAPAAVGAQTRDPGRFEFGLGARVTGGSALAPVAAGETTPGGSAFSLFTTRSAFGPAIGVEGRLSARVARWLHIEAAASYGRPRLTTSITSDFEDAPATAAAESLIQVRVEGGVLVPVSRWHIGTRAVPFLAAGGGYLRELHEGQTIVETGRSYYVGGGLNYALNRRTTRRFDTIGVRLDARASIRRGGISLDAATHVAPSLGTSLFVRF